jgi:hypothetical protein
MFDRLIAWTMPVSGCGRPTITSMLGFVSAPASAVTWVGAASRRRRGRLRQNARPASRHRRAGFCTPDIEIGDRDHM